MRGTSGRRSEAAGSAGRVDVAGVGPRAAGYGRHRVRAEVLGGAGRLDSLLP